MLFGLPSSLVRALVEQAEAWGANCACHCDGHHDDAESEDAIRFVEGLEELTHIDAALDKESSRWTLPMGCRLTVLFFGPASTGKTSLYRLLSSKDTFGAEGRSQRHVSFNAVQRWQSSDGGLCLLDAAGFEKAQPSSEEVSHFLAEVSLAAPQGVSMLFYVVKFGSISEDCLGLLIFLTKYVFDTSCLLNLYVVVTHAPPEMLQHRGSADSWVQSQAETDPGFREVYTLAGCNPSRFIMADTPEQLPGRRLREVEELRRGTARTFYNVFCDHPTSIVADFNMPLTREVQDAVKVQGRALLEAQMEVARLRGEMRRRPYGRKLSDLNEDSPSAKYHAQLWNLRGSLPTPVLPSVLPGGQDGDGNLKEESDLPARLDKAEACVIAAHEALERRLREVQRAPFYREQVGVLVQHGQARFLEDVRAVKSTPRTSQAMIAQHGTSQTLLASLTPLDQVTRKHRGSDRGPGFPAFAEIAAKMAAANVEERLPCLIFDWDDTLCPTWWMRSVLPPAGQEASATHAVKLALHAGRVEQVLRAARSFGFVDIAAAGHMVHERDHWTSFKESSWTASAKEQRHEPASSPQASALPLAWWLWGCCRLMHLSIAAVARWSDPSFSRRHSSCLRQIIHEAFARLLCKQMAIETTRTSAGICSRCRPEVALVPISSRASHVEAGTRQSMQASLGWASLDKELGTGHATASRATTISKSTCKHQATAG